MRDIKGHLFNIQRFSLDDGPGIRSTVFLKGCNQRCAWCHNPESLRVTPQLMRKHSICTGCGACINACPRGANTFTREFDSVLAEFGANEVNTHAGSAAMENAHAGSTAMESIAASAGISGKAAKEETGRKVITSEKCIGCGTCVQVCPVRALKVMGYTSTVEETMAVVVKDRKFYERSGGGVTFSGGEPTCQKEFLLAMLDECGKEGLHRAIETNGNTPIELVKEISERLEYVMIDLKHVDEEKHRRFTGAGTERMLDSIRYYVSHNETEVRIPVIPTFNDTPEELQGMFDFLDGCGASSVTLLPYHTFGISKYESLSMDYPLEEREATETDKVQALLDQVDTRGIYSKIK